MILHRELEVLSIRPNWDNLSDNNFADYKVEAGSAGISTVWDTREQPRRQAKTSWLLGSKQEIDCFQAFVERHKGRGHAFWLPLWQMMAPIQQRVITGGGGSFNMIFRFDRMNLASLYSTYGDQFSNFLLVSPSQMHPVRAGAYTTYGPVPTRESLTLPLQSNLFTSYTEADSAVCPLMLCRFASDEFKYFYVSEQAAVIHNRFSELPKEYGTAGTVSTVAYAYVFTNPTGTYRYIDYPREVTIGGNTYAPANIIHERVQRNDNFLDEQVRMTVGVDSTTHPLRDFTNPRVNYRTYVTVYYATVSHSADTATVSTEFTGEIDTLSYDPSGNINLECSTSFKRGRTGVVPTMTLQKKCNWRLFGPNCGLNSASYSANTTVAAVTSESITYGTLTNTTSESTNWLTYGSVTFGNETRTILKHDSSAKILYLNAPFKTNPGIGATITTLPGCNKTNTQCVSKYNNVANFGGFPLMPKRPSWLEALQPPEDKATKK